jgi:1,4-dihydroxy-2-naphthoate polyprenyltransferase
MTRLQRWVRSLRAYSFPASVIPVLLALALAVSRDASIRWWTVPVFLAAAVLFHAGTNVLNDYYDYLSGVDGPDDRDPTHTIPRGIVTPRFMVVSGHLYFALGFALGSALAAVRGPAFWLAGSLGTLGGYLYTGRRISLKYRALGDTTVFLLMGPALVWLGYWAFTGDPGATAALVAVPIAFLVTLILHGNNMRDIEVDGNAGVDTIARRLGFDGSKVLFDALLLGAYLSMALLAVTGTVPAPAAASLASLPVAWKLRAWVHAARDGSVLMDIPLRAAQLHLIFGVLYLAGIAVARIR